MEHFDEMLRRVKPSFHVLGHRRQEEVDQVLHHHQLLIGSPLLEQLTHQHDLLIQLSLLHLPKLLNKSTKIKPWPVLTKHQKRNSIDEQKLFSIEVLDLTELV